MNTPNEVTFISTNGDERKHRANVPYVDGLNSIAVNDSGGERCLYVSARWFEDLHDGSTYDELRVAIENAVGYLPAREPVLPPTLFHLYFRPHPKMPHKKLPAEFLTREALDEYVKQIVWAHSRRVDLDRVETAPNGVQCVYVSLEVRDSGWDSGS
jgi:hypothetical protein